MYLSVGYTVTVIANTSEMKSIIHFEIVIQSVIEVLTIGSFVCSY